MLNISNITRRHFFRDTALATAVASLPSAIAPAENTSRSVNERISLAVLGCRIRGQVHVHEYTRLPGCDVSYVCDPDRELAEKLAEQLADEQGYRPGTVQDMRHIFDDESVDAVSIATPNHWHALAAIWAMQAGKDVYVEKPVSHTVSEGRRMVQVARKTGCICQAGIQRRSEGPLAAIIEYLRQGKLGDVKLAKAITYAERRSIGGPGRYAIPSNVDYNLWAGPAPMSPLTRPRFHYDWHWFWETGNGESGNKNIHTVDVCRWGLNLSGLGRSVISFGGRFVHDDAGQTPNTQVVLHDYGDKTIIQEIRGLKSKPSFLSKHRARWVFVGTEGFVVNTSLFDPEGKLIREFTGEGENHFANFLEAVRSRKLDDLNADIIEGHQSSALCHIGNISYRLGRLASPLEIGSELEAVDGCNAVYETFERTCNHLAHHGVDLEKTKTGDWPIASVGSGGRDLHRRSPGKLTIDSHVSQAICHPRRK